MKASATYRIAVLTVLILAFAVLPTGASLWADVVYYKAGGYSEGRIISQNENEVVLEIATAGGRAQITIPRGFISDVEYAPTGYEKQNREFDHRASALTDKDARGWFELGLWAETQPLIKGRASEAYARALLADPSYAPAHLKLGHVLYEGVWMSYDDMMRMKGYVQYKGEWMTVETKMQLLLKEKELEIAQQRLRIAEAEQRKAEAEAAKAESERKPTEVRTETVYREVYPTTTYVVSDPVFSSSWVCRTYRPNYTFSRFRYDHAPSPYYIKYPYRHGYRPPAPCSSISVSYSNVGPSSAVRVGFFFGKK
ncbi:MAG: hypothetical protein WC712_05135 [Candidatus Brocadiia bacterium]